MNIVEWDVARADPLEAPRLGVVLYWRGDTPLGANAMDRPVDTVSRSRGRRLSISVAVCSRDRVESLRSCLESLRNQETRPEEILVVDNGSRDAAAYRRVADDFAARYSREASPGVRFARNRALREAEGEIIAFIDDDCRPVSRWLTAVRHAFETTPGAACCTGPVLADEVGTEAQRLMELRGGFGKGFARRTFTRGSHAAVWRSYPLQSWMYGTGGNMAFRREALLKAGGFATELPRGEDLDAFFRILRDGHALVYEPCAAVSHAHLREYPALRQRLFGWGYGYSAYLMRVAHAEPLYRRKALREIAGFVAYHARERLWPALRGRSNLPLDLIAAEFFGALAGPVGYWRDRRRSRNS